MQKRKFAVLLASCFMCMSGMAQMEFSFTGVTATAVPETDGVTLVEFPSGTNLNDFANLGMSVTVDGQAVSLTDISPNPSTTFITDGEIELFTYQNKVYPFRFTNSTYFTCVMFTDPHVAESAGASVADMQGFVSNIVNMGKAGGKQFAFDAVPIVPQADLVLCLGDMDKDNEKTGDDFKNAVADFATANIPFLTICGNHDLVPDYWTGDNPDKGLTFGIGNDGGMNTNSMALKLVKSYANTAVTNGITDYQTFDDNSGKTQFDPYTFTFRGVRFYMGQTYWFQKPYDKPTLTSAAKYYAPDGVVSQLENFVENHKDEASVWCQHYPLQTGSDIDRWWLDQNDKGKTIAIENTTAYPTAKDKRDKYTEIIKKTTNPKHFAGHMHSYATESYNGVNGYVASSIGESNPKGDALIVLMKSGVGVVEVKQVSFK